MIFKKPLILALCLSIVLGAVPAYARFRGGSIKDIPRRIKEGINAAKESEIYKQYVVLRDDYKEMKVVWNDFNDAYNKLDITVTNIVNGNVISDLLTPVDEKKELDAKLARKFQFDLKDNKNTNKNRKDALEKLIGDREEEFKKTVKVAENISKIGYKLNEMALDISGDKSGGGYAAKQRDAVLELSTLVAKNQAAQLENQMLANEIEGRIMEENFRMYEDLSAKSLDIAYPMKDDPELIERVNDNRMTELPR